MSKYCKAKPSEATNVNNGATNVNIDASYVNPETTNMNIHKCETCYKSYARKHLLEQHKPHCQHVQSPLECPKCHNVFSCYSSKARHVKSCTVSASVPTTTTVQVQAPTNMYTIHGHNVQVIHGNVINNHIHQTLRNFGDEDLSYISNEYLVTKFINVGGGGFMDLMRNIYFNPEHPENQNFWFARSRNASEKECFYKSEDGDIRLIALSEIQFKVIDRVSKLLNNIMNTLKLKFGIQHVAMEYSGCEKKLEKFYNSANQRTVAYTKACQVIKAELKAAKYAFLDNNVRI